MQQVSGESYKKENSSGFSFIELLLVFGMITILAVAIMTLVNPIGQLQKGRDAKRKSDLAQVQRALEIYYNDVARYPEHDASTYEIKPLGVVKAWGGPWLPYMPKLPVDSLSRKYIYYASPDGQTYYIYASLERGGKDPQACNSGNACTSVGANGIPTNPSACGGTCNYGATSPNVSP